MSIDLDHAEWLVIRDALAQAIQLNATIPPGRQVTRQDAARELGRGLMRGKRDELKLGYSWENAALVAIDSYGLTPNDQTALRMYLRGFALGLRKVTFGAACETAHTHPEDYRDTLRTGLEHGWANAEGSYPAEVERNA